MELLYIPLTILYCIGLILWIFGFAAMYKFDVEPVNRIFAARFLLLTPFWPLVVVVTILKWLLFDGLGELIRVARGRE